MRIGFGSGFGTKRGTVGLSCRTKGGNGAAQRKLSRAGLMVAGDRRQRNYGAKCAKAKNTQSSLSRDPPHAHTQILSAK